MPMNLISMKGVLMKTLSHRFWIRRTEWLGRLRSITSINSSAVAISLGMSRISPKHYNMLCGMKHCNSVDAFVFEAMSPSRSNPVNTQIIELDYNVMFKQLFCKQQIV